MNTVLDWEASMDAQNVCRMTTVQWKKNCSLDKHQQTLPKTIHAMD
jgi:hypothetical protein